MNPNEETLDESLDSLSQGEEEDVPEVKEEEKKASAAEERINQLVGKIKEFEEKLEAKKEQTPVIPASDNSTVTPEMQKAVEYLKSLKFVQEGDMEKKVEERLSRFQDRIALDSEHTRLQNAYGGSDGRPKYDKEAVERFMRDKGVYDPAVAYEQLHKTELFDWQMKQLEEQSKKQPYVEKKGTTTATREENTITREQIADWMKTPEGRVKYERNRNKILSLVQQGQL